MARRFGSKCDWCLIILENSGFNTFTAVVKEAHNVFHRAVGGDMGSPPTGSIDIVFYMYHHDTYSYVHDVRTVGYRTRNYASILGSPVLSYLFAFFFFLVSSPLQTFIDK